MSGREVYADADWRPTFHECELVFEESPDLLSPHVTNCSAARLCGRGDDMKY